MAHERSGGPGVGAVGMCFTGTFALDLMLEPAVIAPILSQPSLPLTNASGLHIEPSELERIKARLVDEDLTVRSSLEGDRLCTSARFEAYQEALGSALNPECYPTRLPNKARAYRRIVVITT